MRNLSIAAMPLLLSFSSLAAAQAAPQAAPSPHEQHRAIGQHQVKAEGEHRNCEQMMQEMHQMMTEMKKMHQGMGAHSGHDANKDLPQPRNK